MKSIKQLQAAIAAFVREAGNAKADHGNVTKRHGIAITSIGAWKTLDGHYIEPDSRDSMPARDKAVCAVVGSEIALLRAIKKAEKALSAYVAAGGKLKVDGDGKPEQSGKSGKSGKSKAESVETANV